MTKLKDLREEYKSINKDSDRAKDIRKEINRIEEWCINQGYKGFKITNWDDSDAHPEGYPWHTGCSWVEDIWQIGSLNGKGINFNKDGSIHLCELD